MKGVQESIFVTPNDITTFVLTSSGRGGRRERAFMAECVIVQAIRQGLASPIRVRKSGVGSVDNEYR